MGVRSPKQFGEEKFPCALDIFLYGNIYSCFMARAATTSDAYNAVAEPRRREILDYLAMAELPVGDLVVKLGLEQPSVLKALAGAARRWVGQGPAAWETHVVSNEWRGDPSIT